MSLADYRAHAGVNADLAEPLAGRLLRLLDLYGGRVQILSGRRTREEQQALWDAHPNPAFVAPPGTSKHERGEAADLQITAPNLGWSEVHLAAATYGLRFPVPKENWHCEADPAYVDPPEDDPDMTPQEMAHVLGCTLDGYGRAVVPVGNQLYPLANVIAFLLDEVQREDLLVQRIKNKLSS